MRYSQVYIPTRKEDPADAEVLSHKLMLRAGFIRQVSAGIYSFLPLGWRVVRKIQQIVREEMNRAGGQEVFLPAVQPATLWKQSGRWDFYGPELLRFKDRKGNDYCLGPTHEEVMVDLIRDEVRSYRQLPLNLYQIQSKFRDELRPRAGLMRGREFVMKDAYSFDVDAERAKESYDRMFEAYNRIFTRCGLTFRPVEADTGNIGGSVSHEFQVLADSGEDAITSCASCDYTANVELAELGAGESRSADAVTASLEQVATPGQKTVDEVTGFLKVSPQQLVKTLIYRVVADPDQTDSETKLLAVLVRGDAEANELKVARLVDVRQVELANDSDVQALTGAPVGFAGPIGLSGVPIYADHQVAEMADFVVGANVADAHFTGANWGRDFEVTQFGDLRVAGEGDPCGRCGHALTGYRGIEVGHIFLLGTKYSEPMKARFLDERGRPQPFVMGCYGIGITRIVSAAIEQNHDDGGIVWPLALAPFQALVIALQHKNEDVMRVAGEIHDAIEAAGLEVLLDDRKQRPGFKFKDADLVGIPIRIAVGARSLEEGYVELKLRGAGDVEKVPVAEAADRVITWINETLS